jgi:hypothetical protein
MAGICPSCGEESLMMASIGMIFGVEPFCANSKCKNYKEFPQ